jgi:hypothetical protein
MDSVNYQDLTIMESQGPISARENWRMATSDRGIEMLHHMLFREMDKVAQGLDPVGVCREPDDPTVAPALWEPNGQVRSHGVRVYPSDAVPAGAS